MKSKVHKAYPNWEDGLTACRTYLNNSKKYKILVEQNRNLGDTLHLTPIIKHYRILFPDANIAFITAKPYGNAHEFNPHIDRLFLIPKLEPNARITMRRKMLTFKEIDQVIAPSIFPYGAIWKELNWSQPNIANQYFYNAGIPKMEPKGGRKLIVNCTKADMQYAASFYKKHRINPKRTCIIEYNSYSARPKWSYSQFEDFVKAMKSHGIECISMAGKRERALAGTISAIGTNWRQAVALLELAGGFVGSGSGLTMLAAAANHPPIIWEVGIPKSVSMEGCKYAPSKNIAVSNPFMAAGSVAKVLKTLK